MKNYQVDKNCIIFKNVIIGEGSIIEGPSIIGKPARGNADGQSETKIGKNSTIRPFTTIYHGTITGDYFQTGQGVSIREDNLIENNVSIGTNTVLEFGSRIDDFTRIHSNCFLEMVEIGKNVFIGPNVVFTNDRNPRSGVIRDLTGISWSIGKGSSIGASSTIMSDINIGKYAMVGANSLVTKDVPNHGLVYGSPAKLMGYVCKCGMKFEKDSFTKCKKCEMEIDANGKIIQE